MEDGKVEIEIILRHSWDDDHVGVFERSDTVRVLQQDDGQRRFILETRALNKGGAYGKEEMVQKRSYDHGLLFSMMVAGIGSALAAPAPATIKLGAVIALTGAMASGGKDVKAGYEIAVKHINDAGGVFVKEYNKKLPLELIIVDDESDAVKTTTRLDKLSSVDNVVAYLGGFSSDLNVVGMSTAEKNKVPWIGVTVAAEAPFKKGFQICLCAVFSGGRSGHDLLRSSRFDSQGSETDEDWPSGIAGGLGSGELGNI